MSFLLLFKPYLICRYHLIKRSYSFERKYIKLRMKCFNFQDKQQYKLMQSNHCSHDSLCTTIYLATTFQIQFCVACTSRVGICGSRGARQCLIPAGGWSLLVSVLPSLLLLLRQLLVLPRHVLLPQTLWVQNIGVLNTKRVKMVFFGKSKWDCVFLCHSIRGRQGYKVRYLHPPVTNLPSILCFWCADNGPHRSPLSGGQDFLCSSFRWQPPHSWYVIISKLNNVLKLYFFIVVCFVVKRDASTVLKSSQNIYSDKKTCWLPCWWLKCISAVPMHAVGVPYRVPTPQDQDSLRVLQYVERQLAHFNPARSTSHQCKSHKHILWIYSEPASWNLQRMLYYLRCQFCIYRFLVSLLAFACLSAWDSWVFCCWKNSCNLSPNPLYLLHCLCFFILDVSLCFFFKYFSC